MRVGAAHTQTGCWRRGGRRALLGKLRSWDASWSWRGQVRPPRRGPAARRGPPRKSPSRRPTGGEGLAQRARFGLRKWERAPRVETTRGAWGGRPPEDDGTHTLEAHRTDAFQGVTKEEGTFRGRRRRREDKRHGELAKALVDGTTRLDSKRVESFTLCFGLSGPAPLLPQRSLLRGGTCPGGGSHANVLPARATGGNVSELVLTANPVEYHQARALIRASELGWPPSAVTDFGLDPHYKHYTAGKPSPHC